MSIYYYLTVLYMIRGSGLGDCVLCHFQQYFSYIVAVTKIGGGNRSTKRKPQHDLSHVTDKLYQIKLYRVHLSMSSSSMIGRSKMDERLPAMTPNEMML